MSAGPETPIDLLPSSLLPATGQPEEVHGLHPDQLRGQDAQVPGEGPGPQLPGR